MRTKMLQLRVSRGELARWRKAAKRSEMNVSAWVRLMCGLGAGDKPVVPPTISGDQLAFPLKAPSARRARG